MSPNLCFQTTESFNWRLVDLRLADVLIHIISEFGNMQAAL